LKIHLSNSKLCRNARHQAPSYYQRLRRPLPSAHSLSTWVQSCSTKPVGMAKLLARDYN
jgi:hypothetical protein